jgi:hypothetical protein
MKPKQVQAAQFLAAGESRSAVARKLGVSRRTIVYWQLDPDFRELARPAQPEPEAALEGSRYPPRSVLDAMERAPRGDPLDMPLPPREGPPKPEVVHQLWYGTELRPPPLSGGYWTEGTEYGWTWRCSCETVIHRGYLAHERDRMTLDAARHSRRR